MSDRIQPASLHAYRESPRPFLLDLFCGAGGAAMGYANAGFDVIGVDIKRQPRYPFPFIQGDAMEVGRALLATGRIDAVHASPPCQAYSDMKHMPDAKQHPELVEPVREMLQEWGGPYAIENVEGAPLLDPITLCGSMFDLGVLGFQLRRHRLFESNVALLPPRDCAHRQPTIGIYGGHVRCRSKKFWRDTAADFPGYDKPTLACAAMGAGWMTMGELSEAIPPAYTQHVGAQLLAVIESEATDAA